MSTEPRPTATRHPPARGRVADPRRLKDLRELDVAGSSAPPAFDHLLELTRSVLHVGVATISFVDDERLHLVSAVGLPRDTRAPSGSPPEGLLDRRVVETSAPLAVDDVDPGHPDEWLFRGGLRLRCYAGTPLTTSAGHTLGALSVMDEAPRRWSADDLDLLSSLSASLVREIELEASRRRERRRGDRLAKVVDERTVSLELSRRETVRRMASAIAARSDETGAHSDRMGAICSCLADRVGIERGHSELIGIASALHDVGKLAIPDGILNKPGPLTAGERAVIETHAEIGHEMLTGSGDPLLEMAAVMARTHHEWIDGSGYPHGLRGDDIPIEGRIAAVADVYDALTNDRVFRPAFPVGEAMRMIAAGRGRQFAPPVVDALRDALADVLSASLRAAEPTNGRRRRNGVRT